MTKPVTSKITRIGNSKGIILPMQVVKALALSEGDVVEMTYHDATQELLVTFPATKQLSLGSKFA